MAYGVVDGQDVSAAITNPAFIVKNNDDSTTHKLGLQSPDVGDGPLTYSSAQAAINTLDTTTGATETVPATTYGAAAGTISDGQNHQQALTTLANKFDTASGHRHDGLVPGDGRPIVASDLASVPLRGYVQQGTDILAVTGTSSDISTQFSSKTASAGSSSVGVVVTAPYNKVILRQASGVNEGDEFVDGAGNEVYGRVTNSGATWTLSYYVELAGVETVYNFLIASDVRFYYQELFNPMDNPPVYSEFAVIPSDNVTADAVDASQTQRGVVSTGSQTFGGEKTLFDGIIIKTSLAIPKLDETISASGTILYLPFKKLLAGASYDIQGISNGADGKNIILYNSSSFSLVIKNEDLSASAADRFTLPGAADLSLDPNKSFEFIYDSGASRWVVKSSSGSASSTPGGNPTDVQFNDGGVFNGTDDLTFDKVNAFLGIKQATPQARIHANPVTTSGTVGDDVIIVGKPDSGGNIGNGALIANGYGGANFCEGENASVFGHGNDSSGTNAFSAGSNNTANGQDSACFGRNSQTAGLRAFSAGIGNNANADDSATFGNSTTANGVKSMATGNTTTTSHDQSFSTGLNTKTGRVSQTVLGEWNTGAADTLLEVGNGTGLGSEANAFAVSDSGEALNKKVVYLPDSTQTLGAGFTVSFNKTYTKISSAGDVTSSAVTAIAAGTREGQIILLDNRGSFNITLTNGAGVELPGAIDYTIGPKGTIEFIWTGTNWRCKAASSN